VNASYVALLLVRVVVGGTMIAHGMNHWRLSAACLALAVLGPGRFSVDSAAGIAITGWAGGGIALGVAVAATAGLLATFWRPKRDAGSSDAEAARS
jgi:hypothetical protein